MVNTESTQLYRNDMGQTSSQIHPPSTIEPVMEDLGKSSDKKSKSKKSKRKSLEAEQPLDPEEESARALLQMRGVDVLDDRAPYYGADLAASQQHLVEGSPTPASALPAIEEDAGRSSQKEKKRDKSDKKKKKKQQRKSEIAPFGSEERNEEFQYPQLPSTPPGRTHLLSPSPLHPITSQSLNALDEVPTDDETAAFEEEFGNGNTNNAPAMADHDLFSFSQQPLDIVSQEDPMHPTYRLPTQVYTSPKAATKLKKRKKHATSAFDGTNGEHVPFENGTGQHTFEFDQSPENDYLRDFVNLANTFGDLEGHEMPIDPELHSMSALPPSIDLSALDDGQVNGSRPKRRKSNPNGSSQPRKRRRVEDIQYDDHDHYYSPYAIEDGQENIQDRVLPGLEDMQRQSSPELGTPFIENIARGGLEYLDSTTRPAKVSKHKKQKNKSANESEVQPPGLQKGRQIEPSIKDVSEKGGPFAVAEIEKLDNFRDRYCDANKMNPRLFNSLVQTPMRGNAQVTALFNELHEVLPYRPRMSVQKFVRRHFHNYLARGVWTAEEDEELRRAIAEKGKQWKAVGEMVDRMPGDCRDRWRNYLLNSEHRNREQWTDDEVRNLCTAILQCIQLMKNARKLAREEKYGAGAPEVDEDSEQEFEDIKVINWQAVSDRMGEHGGGRSRLQCSFKWGQLKKKDQSDLINEVRDAQEFEAKKTGSAKNPWRHKRATKKVANMKTGDKYLFLQAILECNAPVDGNIPWKALGDDKFRALWKGADKKTAWYTMKASVPGSDSMDYREAANRLLTHILAEGSEELDERWDPEVHGDPSQPKPRKSNKASGKQREDDGADSRPKGRHRKDRERKSAAKSQELVVDTDEEDDDAAYQPQDHNPYSVLPRSAKADRYVDRNGEATASAASEPGRQDDHFSDRDSLFDEPDEESVYPPRHEGEMSPEMISRVHMLRDV